jgi:hypothetical protein
MDDDGVGGVPEVYFIVKGWVTPDLDDYFIYKHMYNNSIILYTVRSNDNVRPRTAWDRTDVHCYTSAQYYKS